MGRRHLFLALSRAAYGEATLALRLAWQLHANGDQVVVLAPSELLPLWSGTPFQFGSIDAVARVIHDAIPGVVAKQKCDDVVLVDLTSTILACRLYGIDPGFVHRLTVPVVALDAWNLPETSRHWDVGAETLDLSGLDIAGRLIAVPFVRPDVAGAYCALPDAGVQGRRPPNDPRRILITTAAWQAYPPRGVPHRGLLDVIPEILIDELAMLPSNVEVHHVGPIAFSRTELLGARYRWRGRVSPPEMQTIVAESDLLVTLNLASTTIGTALACTVPTVVAINSFAGTTTLRSAEVVERVGPLHPFLVWPLGLHAFLAPVLVGNPYSDVVRTAELMIPGAIAKACREVLFDETARDTLAERIAIYVKCVRELPSGAERLSSLW